MVVGMNREFAFYCPELDCIVIQIIMDNCLIAFEWRYGLDDETTNNEMWYQDVNNPNLLLMPLGEV